MKFVTVLSLLLAVASAHSNGAGRIFNGRDAHVGVAPFMIQFRQIQIGQTFAQHFFGGKMSIYLK